MPSLYLMQVLVALIAIATVDSFIPIGSCSRPTTTTRTSSSLYGIFDSIGKAFGNEEYGESYHVFLNDKLSYIL